MAKKEKEKVFTEMQFNDAQYAQDVLANSQSKLERCKIALIVALVVQVLWLLAFLHRMPLAKCRDFWGILSQWSCLSERLLHIL